ncbi:MAG: type II toxin-antitoxin system RelE/ParE family toxin [Porphyromonadaceae bacterium]|nr:type II toxin-antitoxin system RelE/ParE family toxin [Porphyromonadaceae bacterium]
MKYYTVHISDQAVEDLDKLFDIIFNKYRMPNTAFKYLKELRKVIISLSRNAETYQIQTRASLQQYGLNVRRINYKKMAIIYTVHGELVYIHRVVPQNSISGL